MNTRLETYLLEASTKEYAELSPENPFKETGFDAGKKRLGWVRPAPFESVRRALESLRGILEGKETFVFVGMGGSINGIKPLIALYKATHLQTLDNLDPAALKRVLAGVRDLKKTLIIPISKSGTTTETQLLALTLKQYVQDSLGEEAVKDHFLWLSDPNAFSALEQAGWSAVQKAAIQFDGGTDVGGRFSSPHTLIFMLPLYVLLNKDMDKLQRIYDGFVGAQQTIRKKADSILRAYRDKPNAYFAPHIGKKLGASFGSWIVQLFQESIGSKLEKLPVKTIIGGEGADFSPVRLSLRIPDQTVMLIAQMYFFQVFIAYFCASRGINFVNQNYVEEYKNQMRRMSDANAETVKSITCDPAELVSHVSRALRPEHRFIELVLYFYPKRKTMRDLSGMLQSAFGDRQVLSFVGSDWNHQSYQAAFASNDTLYILLVMPSYARRIRGIPSRLLTKNAQTLALIAQATYVTLKDKALLLESGVQ